MTVVGAGYSFLDEVWGEAPGKSSRGTTSKRARQSKSVHCDLATQKPRISRPYAAGHKGGLDELHPDMKDAWEESDRAYMREARAASRRTEVHAADADDDAYFDTALAAGNDGDRDGLHDYYVDSHSDRVAHEPDRVAHEPDRPEPVLDGREKVPDAPVPNVRTLESEKRRDDTMSDILRSAREAKEAAEAALVMIREDRKEKSARSKNLDLVAYILGGIFTILVLEQVVQMGQRVPNVMAMSGTLN